MARELTIGVLSEQTGVNIETIRYYERIGILPSPPRSAGGHRLYGQRHRKRLIFVRRSRELEFTLEEIRKLLRLVDSGHTCCEVQAVVLDHLKHVRARIADLRCMEATLAATAARCEGSDVPECPIIDALSE